MPEQPLLSPTIPWVIRRVTERPTPWSGGLTSGVNMRGEVVQALFVDGAYQDEHGWLWQPAITDLSGAPEWTQVHPERHRLCMDESRCQVCGEQADDILWRIAKHDVQNFTTRSRVGPHSEAWHTSRRAVTHTPPVCRRCEPVARRLCPHLRRNEDAWQTYTAERVVWAGVLGDVYDKSGSGKPIREAWVQRFEPDAPMTLAKQRVVRLYGLKEFN